MRQKNKRDQLIEKAKEARRRRREKGERRPISPPRKKKETPPSSSSSNKKPTTDSEDDDWKIIGLFPSTIHAKNSLVDIEHKGVSETESSGSEEPTSSLCGGGSFFSPTEVEKETRHASRGVTLVKSNSYVDDDDEESLLSDVEEVLCRHVTRMIHQDVLAKTSAARDEKFCFDESQLNRQIAELVGLATEQQFDKHMDLLMNKPSLDQVVEDNEARLSPRRAMEEALAKYESTREQPMSHPPPPPPPPLPLPSHPRRKRESFLKKFSLKEDSGRANKDFIEEQRDMPPNDHDDKARVPANTVVWQNPKLKEITRPPSPVHVSVPEEPTSPRSPTSPGSFFGPLRKIFSFDKKEADDWDAEDDYTSFDIPKSPNLLKNLFSFDKEDGFSIKRIFSLDKSDRVANEEVDRYEPLENHATLLAPNLSTKRESVEMKSQSHASAVSDDGRHSCENCAKYTMPPPPPVNAGNGPASVIRRILTRDIWSNDTIKVENSLDQIGDMCFDEINDEECAEVMNNRAEVLRQGGHLAIVVVLQKYWSNMYIQESGLRCLVNVSLNSKKAQKLLSKVGVIEQILQAMSTFKQSSRIQDYGCAALGNLVDDNHENALCVLKAGGLDIVTAAMRRHPKDEELQADACSFLGDMSRRDLKTHVLAAGAATTLACVIEGNNGFSEQTRNLARDAMLRLMQDDSQKTKKADVPHSSDEEDDYYRPPRTAE